MAARERHDRIGALVRDVEAAAKRLRTDIRKRANETGILRNLEAAANRLRKQAAAVAAQVEKYAHEIRKELEGAKAKAPAKRSKARARKK